MSIASQFIPNIRLRKFCSVIKNVFLKNEFYNCKQPPKTLRIISVNSSTNSKLKPKHLSEKDPN